MARSIVDVFARLFADDTGFEADVVKKAQKAGDAAGLSMGQRIASGISKGATQIGQTLAQVGQGLTKTGSAMTRNLTLPILAAGAAVTHFALDFDTKLRQIVALSDVTQAEISGIREEILKLGPEVGKSPQELADAFYFLASSGLSAKDAMAALKIAAKASATGMGLTSDIAKVLAATINAYGKENITAARAGDVLTAAVKDGSAEASDFAGALGRVVPVAAALGVSFDQVSAALSGMTLVGISTDEATTSLVQIFSALLKTTPQAEDAMKALGLSSAGLRQELKEKGLIATLRTLQTAFGDNETAASAVFGNIRALRGITALLSLDQSQLNKVFADTNAALGDLNQAYDETAGPQRELDKAMADLQVTAIELGADTMPMVVDALKQIAGAARELAKWWKSLDADTRKQIVQWLAWLAVVGPVLLIAGKLVSAFGAVFKAIGFLAGAKGIPALLGSITKGRLLMLGWLGVILGVTAALEAAAGPVSDFFDTLIAGKKANKTLHELNALTDDMMKAQVLRAMGVDAREFAQAIEAAGGDADYAFQTIKDSAGDAGLAIATMSGQLGEVSETGGAMFGRLRDEVHRAATAAAKEAEQLPKDLVATLEDGQFVVGPAAEIMVDPIAEAVEKAKQDVADAANDLIHTLATTLSSNPKELQDAAKAMWDDILHPFPDIKQRLQIEGILANKTLIKGLTSPDSGDRARTAEYIKGLLANYEDLAPGALAAGKLINPALQRGIDATLGALTTYLQTQTGDIVNQYDLADELGRMGYDSLAQYVRGLEDARIAKLNHELYMTNVAIHTGLDDDYYQEGYDATKTYANGIAAGGKEAIAYVQDFTGKIKHLLTLPGSPEYYHAKEAGEGVAQTYMQRMVATIQGALPRLGSSIASIASAMAFQPMGLAAASVPSMARTGAAGMLGRASSSSTLHIGEIHLHGIGSDVSSEAARSFGQRVIDEVATGLQEQSARFGSRPRVNLA